MRALESPDLHRLSFATGWMELGALHEARDELARLTVEATKHPDVMEAYWVLAASEGDWKTALSWAEKLLESDSKRASGWLHRSYALRRVPGGSLSAARESLLPAVTRFPGEPTIPYNLACYACQLGQIEEARQWLLSARKVGDSETIKRMTLADEDLKPFWPEVADW